MAVADMQEIHFARAADKESKARKGKTAVRVCAVQMDICRLNPKWLTIIWKKSDIRDGIECDVLW